MEEKTILTSQCENCKYGSVDYEDKARMTVYCSYKEKKYMYGQRIPCAYYEEREIDDGK